MMGDRWTLLLLRGEDRPLRQYTLSPRVLAWGAGALGILVVVAAVASAAIGIGGTARLESLHLRAENRALSAELDRLREAVGELEGTVGELASRDAALRSMAGLDPIDGEILQVGVGGPGAPGPEAHPLFGLDPELGNAAFAIGYDLDAIRRRARLLAESMDEAADSLEAHRDLLLSTPSILPTAGYISSRFSRSRIHPIHHQALPHEGMDISAPRGTPILAAAKGRVVRAGWTTGYGQMVEIDHGYGFITRYGHASKVLVRVGQSVGRGDIIAQVGSTGIATSAHLHYEVRLSGRAQNPMNYVLPGVVP